VGASPGAVLSYGYMFYKAVVCLLRGRPIRGISCIYARGFWFLGLYRLLVLVFSGCSLLKFWQEAN
jgi:hypothetical protein